LLMVSIKDLLNVTIALTPKCNLKCKWCFESATPEKKMFSRKKKLNLF